MYRQGPGDTGRGTGARPSQASLPGRSSLSWEDLEADMCPERGWTLCSHWPVLHVGRKAGEHRVFAVF